MTGVEALNGLDDDAFLARLGGVFEHSPWVLRAALATRPHRDLEHLHTTLCDALDQAGAALQLQLICAHPPLAAREAREGGLTRESRQEQGSAGLDQCSVEERQRLQALNARYRARHGFPFVMAVKGSSPGAILDQMALRLEQDTAGEFQRCLGEIKVIARLRLEALLA